MIAGAYTMDVYCVNAEQCVGKHWRHNVGFAQAVGETAGECRKLLRKKGWKFENDDVTCPACVKRDRNER